MNPNNQMQLRDESEIEIPHSVEVEAQRAIAEVQGQMIIAKRFPRDMTKVMANILTACQRKSMAEQALFSFPRGQDDEGKKNIVSGPSIRIAELIAQNYGNIAFGTKVLTSNEEESWHMAYAWDLETNTKQEKIFPVRHERSTRKGTFKLKDSRDVYELGANLGARRLRACIFGVVPGYIVEEAVEQCERTMKQTIEKEPAQDAAAKLILAFREVGVTVDMISRRLGRPLDSITTTELVEYRKIYVSLRDDMTTVNQWFDVKEAQKAQGQEVANSITDRIKTGTENAKVSVETGAPEANLKEPESFEKAGVSVTLPPQKMAEAPTQTKPEPKTQESFEAIAARAQEKLKKTQAIEAGAKT